MSSHRSFSKEPIKQTVEPDQLSLEDLGNVTILPVANEAGRIAVRPPVDLSERLTAANRKVLGSELTAARMLFELDIDLQNPGLSKQPSAMALSYGIGLLESLSTLEYQPKGADIGAFLRGIKEPPDEYSDPAKRAIRTLQTEGLGILQEGLKQYRQTEIPDKMEAGKIIAKSINYRTSNLHTKTYPGEAVEQLGDIVAITNDLLGTFTIYKGESGSQNPRDVIHRLREATAHSTKPLSGPYGHITAEELKEAATLLAAPPSKPAA